LTLCHTTVTQTDWKAESIFIDICYQLEQLKVSVQYYFLFTIEFLLFLPFFVSFQLRQYVPDERVVGHSSTIGELDVDDEAEEEEYILATEKKAASSGGGLW